MRGRCLATKPRRPSAEAWRRCFRCGDYRDCGSSSVSHGGLRLTDAGRERAVNLVRSHRLWEAYLVEYLGLPLDHVHAPAERMEHYIGDKLQREIAKELPQEATDPHGREIPR